MPQVGFSVQNDHVNHSVIEGVPEIVEAFALGRGHLEVLDVEREVGLPLEAVLVAEVLQSVVAVGLMVPGSDHPRLLGCDRGHLIEELLTERLIALGVLLLRWEHAGVVGTKVALDRLLEELDVGQKGSAV